MDLKNMDILDESLSRKWRIFFTFNFIQKGYLENAISWRDKYFKETSTENNRSYFIDKNIVSTECTTNST